MFAYSRKPAFHFGWDWAAKLTTCGIFKSVYLRGFSKARIQSTLFRNDPVISTTSIASIRVFGVVELNIASSDAFEVKIWEGSNLLFKGLSTPTLSRPG